MLNQKKTLAHLLLLLILTVTTLFIFESCRKDDIFYEKEYFFPDDGDDQEINGHIVTYNIYNDNIYLNKIFPVPNDNVDNGIWEKQQKAIEEHKKMFKFFTDIIPAEYRKEITKFTVSYPEKGSNVYAGMDRRKKSSISQFSLNISYDFEKAKTKTPAFSAPDYKYNTLGYDIATYSMIHEFGHYVTLNKTQTYLKYFPENDDYGYDYKKGSFLRQIIDISWTKLSKLPDEILTSMNPSKIFNALPGEFVSAYACNSMNEDGAETFTHFVLLNDKPEDVDGKGKKILLFYKDPEMVKIRTQIRQNLQKMGIVPGKPNM